jgi:hypothetical protein
VPPCFRASAVSGMLSNTAETNPSPSAVCQEARGSFSTGIIDAQVTSAKRFGVTLLGVAVFHHHTLQLALTRLSAITLYKLGFTGFKSGAGLSGLAEHMRHEWVILTNLFLLLMGLPSSHPF